MISSSWRARAVIDPQAFISNLNVARRHAPNSQLMAVVKANAYGHGISTLKQALSQADQLAVIDVEEAQALRENGLSQPIAILQGVNTVQALHWCRDNNAQPAICNLQQARLLASHPIEAFWLKVDSGMHRLGLVPEDFVEAVRLLKQAGLTGPYAVMTHFACADCDEALTNRQIESFRALLSNQKTLKQSLANSAAVIDFSASHQDVIRPGIMLYGASPFGDRSAESLGLKPVMSLQAKVAAVHLLEAGEGVGYGMAWKAADNCSVAVLSAGYGDGVPRNLPEGTPVTVGDVKATIVGRVSMDSCFALLPAGAEVSVGDVATLWGQHDNGELLPVDRVAQACGSIGYELLTRVTPRVTRVLKDHARG